MVRIVFVSFFLALGVDRSFSAVIFPIGGPVPIVQTEADRINGLIQWLGRHGGEHWLERVENLKLRRKAAHTLRDVEPEHVTKGLLEALGEAVLNGDDVGVQGNAAYALRSLGERGSAGQRDLAMDYLINGIEGTRGEIRRSVIGSSAKLAEKYETPHKGLADIYIRILNDDEAEAEIRRIAAYYVGSLGMKSDEAIEALEKRLGQSGSLADQTYFSVALFELGKKPGTISLATGLEEQLRSEDKEERMDAAGFIYRLNRAGAPDLSSGALLNAMEADPDYSVRGYAAVAIAALGKRAEAFLEDIQAQHDKEEHETARANMANAIRRIREAMESSEDSP